jgi:hypothetical protein
MCQLNKETHHNIKLPLAITDTKTHPWEKIYLDIVGSLPITEGGMKYILTCQDNLSKYFIAVPIQNQTADEVTNAFVKHIVLVYGIPDEIVTDQGSNFMSDVLNEYVNYSKLRKFTRQHTIRKVMEHWKGRIRHSLIICVALATRMVILRMFHI